MKAVLCAPERIFSRSCRERFLRAIPDYAVLTMPNASRRLLIRAVLASLLGHVLMLVSVVLLWPGYPAVQGAPLRAVVRGPVARLAPVAESPTAPAGTAVLSGDSDRPGVARRLSSSRVRASPPAPLAAPFPVFSGHSPSAAMVSPAPSAHGEATEGIDSESVRQYRFSLALAARGFKPRSDAGGGRTRQGTVEVAVSGHRGSALPQVVLHHSSGITLLDDEAVDMMKRAVGVAALPDGMRGHDFRIVMPLLFGSGEEGSR